MSLNQETKTAADVLVDHLFRRQSARMVATLTRVFGSHRLQLAEDAVQDALIKALQVWPFEGVPENPAGWLTQTAKRRALDLIRRETVLSSKLAEFEHGAPAPAGSTDQAEMDDQLELILMCCHPSIPREAQIALTLKVACGFSVAEIARALLAQDETIAKRITRAKRQIREQAIGMELPAPHQLGARLDAVLQVIYLLFNEGYSASQGENLLRKDLCAEAIRFGDLLAHHPRTNRPEVYALLALMLLQAARLPARTKPGGALALLPEQDRSRWDQRLIAAGMRHLAKSAAGETLTPYHLQAEVAALHAAANSDEETDWAGIAALYEQLYRLDPSPIVGLNRAVAVARLQGPAAGIRLLEEIQEHPALKNYHLLPAVLADLWRQAGDRQKAASYYRQALGYNCTAPERQFLQQQLAQLEAEEN